MKRILMFILVLIVLGAVGGAIVVSQIDPKLISDRLAATSIEATGKPLLLKAVPSISIFPPGVSFGQASWGMIDGKPAKSGISAEVAGGLVRLQLKPLLSGRIHIDEIHIDKPTIFIRPEPEKQDPGAGRELPPQKEAQSFALELAKLEIRDGTVDLALGGNAGKDVKIEHIALTVTNFKPGGVSPVSLDFDFALSDPEIQGAIKSKFDLGVDSGRITLGKGELAFTPRKMPEAYAVKPLELKFSGTVETASNNINLELSSPAASVRNVEMQNVAAKISGKGDLYSVAPLTFSLKGGGKAEIDMSSKNGSKHTLKIKADSVSIGPLMQALQGKRPIDGVADFSADLTAEGKSADAVKSSLAGKGVLTVSGITMNNVSLLPLDAANLPGVPAVPARLDRLNAPFSAAKGIIHISPITLSAPAVSADGQGQVNLPHEHVSFAAEIKLAGLNLPVTAEGPFSSISYGVNKKKLLQESISPHNLLDVTKGAGGRAGEGAKDLGKSLKNLIR